MAAGLGEKSGADVDIGDDPEAAVSGADCVVTDTWVSMGDRDGKHRHNVLKRYQVNAALMAKADPTPSSCTACRLTAVRKLPTR